MLQRNATYVMSSKQGFPRLFGGVYLTTSSLRHSTEIENAYSYILGERTTHRHLRQDECVFPQQASQTDAPAVGQGHC